MNENPVDVSNEIKKNDALNIIIKRTAFKYKALLRKHIPSIHDTNIMGAGEFD